MLNEVCPVCGNNLFDICYTVIPPKYAKQCFNCGYTTETNKDDYEVNKNKWQDKLSNVLGEHFSIPCDMCQHYFKTKDNSCPFEISPCNGKQHWRMLLERIVDCEED